MGEMESIMPSTFAPTVTRIQRDNVLAAKGVMTVAKASDKTFPTVADRIASLRNQAEYLKTLAEKCETAGVRICGARTDSAEDCFSAWVARSANGSAPSLDAE